MPLTRWVFTGLVLLLAACAQTPAKIAHMSEESVHRVPDQELCDAVNSSTRSDSVVAEVKRRQLGCDSIVAHCAKRGFDESSAEFKACVGYIEQRWEAMRLQHEKQEMAREMRRLGDPMRQQRDRTGNVVCRVVVAADGRANQVCRTQ